MKKQLHYAYLGNGMTFWEADDNNDSVGFAGHISAKREFTLLIKGYKFTPENQAIINKIAQSGNYIVTSGNDSYLALNPAKYIQIHALTKEEMRFSVESIDGKMYKCIGWSAFEIEHHPCTRHEKIFHYGDYRQIYVYQSYLPNYLIYTNGEQFAKVPYQFIPKPEVVNQMCKDILSGKMSMYKIDLKVGEWYKTPNTDLIGEYRGERDGRLVFRTSDLQEYSSNIVHFLEIEE